MKPLEARISFYTRKVAEHFANRQYRNPYREDRLKAYQIELHKRIKEVSK